MTPPLRRLAPILACLPLLAACSRQDSRPNIVLVSIDTCRADRVGVAAGGDASNTPNLDALAAAGLRFTDCVAQSTSTGPSHRSLFSGQYVHRHGMYDNFLTDAPYSLASLLRAEGWHTAAFTGGGYVRHKYGLDHGFEVFLEPAGEPWIRPLDEAVGVAERWLRERPEGPFLLFVHGYDPHCPYWPREPWRSRYAGWYTGGLDPRDLCGPRDFQPLLAGGRIGDGELRYLDDLYRAGIASADAALGRLLAALRAQGLEENTLVVVTSDHGESLGEHGWIGHTRMWQEELHVPLVMRFPPAEGSWQGERDAPVELVDLLPTLLDWLGLPVPEGVQGRSLLPLIHGASASPPPPWRLAKFGGREAVLAGRWKVVLRRKDGAVAEARLYDLQEDPGETRDLAGSPEGRAKLDEILGAYQRWREETREDDRRFRGPRRKVEHDASERAALEETGYGGDGGADGDDGS